MTDASAPKVLETERCYEGKIIAVRRDLVELEDGQSYRFEVVEHNDSIVVVPMLDDETIVLVKQYRHPTGQELLELPAGNVETGEDGDGTVQRGLAEEIGSRAREIRRIGGFYVVPGWGNEFMHAYLARDLFHAPEEPDEDERIEVVTLSVAEWERRIAAGEIVDGKSLAAWQLAQAALNA